MDDWQTSVASIICSLKQSLINFNLNLQDIKAQLLTLATDNSIFLDGLKNFVDRIISAEKAYMQEAEEQADRFFEIHSAVFETFCSLINSNQNEVNVNDMNLDAVDRRIAEVRTRYAEAMNILSDELRNTQTANRNLKEQVRIKTEECERNNSERKKYQAILNDNEHKINQLELKEIQLKSQILDLESSVSDIKKQLELKHNETKRNEDELLSSYTNLKQTHSKLYNDFLQLENDAKECLSTTEEALLQKKASELKGRIAENCIREINASINTRIQNISLDNENKIRQITNDYKKEKKTLTNRIATLELNNHEKQGSIEKIRRKNDRLNILLESHTKQSREYYISSEMYNNVTKKWELSEQANNEMLLQLECLKRDLKDVTDSKTAEIRSLKMQNQYLNVEVENLRDRFDAVVNNESAVNEIENLMKMNSSLENKNEALEIENSHLKDNVKDLTNCRIRILELESIVKDLRKLNQEYKKVTATVTAVSTMQSRDF